MKVNMLVFYEFKVSKMICNELILSKFNAIH